MKRSVLVVDDDRGVREMLADALCCCGYEAQTVANGLEALAEVMRDAPDSVVLDMHRPSVGGLAFAHGLRDLGMRVPILVVSSTGEAHRWADVIGAEGYLNKPFDLTQLLSHVDRLCRTGVRAGLSLVPMQSTADRD
ncbi:MAG TPA: response regulator [Chloroflexota bacterium]|nr:response regulator [Chloroflexota bacterium]